MRVSTKQRKGFTVETYTGIGDQVARLAELRAAGLDPMARSVMAPGHGGFSSQPQRRPAGKMWFTIEYPTPKEVAS